MKYKSYREVVRSCFLQFPDASSYSKWPYNQWRHFKKYLDKTKSTRGRLDIEDDGINLIFSDPQTGQLEYIIEKYDSQSFPGFLLAELRKELNMATTTYTTTTASTGFYNDYITTAIPYTTTNTYTYTIPPSSNCGGVVINQDGITINGKKVLTEEDSMTSKDFNMNFDFGPVKDKNIAVSPFGIAIKTVNGEGYCYYDPEKCEVIDCTPFTFDTSKFLFKMPVAVSAVAVGDVIMHRGVPMFVKGVEDNEGRVVVIDVAAAEEKYILPVKNMFGFNFITKIVSLLDMKNSGACVETPFGNMLPLLLMNDTKELDPMMLMLMSGCSGGSSMFQMPQNPLMMYMLMQKNTNISDLVPFILMGNLQQK